MALFKLQSDYRPSGDQPGAISALIVGISRGDRCQTLLGVTGSGKTYTMANIIAQFAMPTLVIAPNKALAAQLYREYKNFFPHSSVNYFVSYYDFYQPEAYLPVSDTYIGKESMINEEIDRLRHQATSALVTRRDVIVVASVSCIYNLGVPETYSQSAIYLETGKFITRGDLVHQLSRLQFLRTNDELKRGTFRVRGDVFEVKQAGEDAIYRIELVGQKVGSISVIDHVTRSALDNLKTIVIFPPRHYVTTQPKREVAIKEIQRELKERVSYFMKRKEYLEADRLQRRTKYDMEMLRSVGYCSGIENYSRHLSGKMPGEPPDTLLSYFPKKDGKPDFLTIVDESHVTVPQIRGMYEGDRSRKDTLVAYGWRLPSALDNRPLTFDEFDKRVGQIICTSATPGEWEMRRSSQIVEQVIRPTGLIDPPIEVRPVHDAKTGKGQIDDFMRELKAITSRNERAIVNTLTKHSAEELSEFLVEKKIKATYMHSDTKTLERTKILTEFREGKFDVLVGVNLLREGLDLPEVSLVAILDADREGFLRSETSLIQTMGRCARNVSGKVILYADTITGSMRRAIDEVTRRREKQAAYNKKHHITPKSIEKKIEQLIDTDDKS